MLVINGWGISREIAPMWMWMDFSDDRSTLDHVMAWCRQAPNHYLSQCWHRSLSLYGVTRPQWVYIRARYHKNEQHAEMQHCYSSDRIDNYCLQIHCHAFQCELLATTVLMELFSSRFLYNAPHSIEAYGFFTTFTNQFHIKCLGSLWLITINRS